MTELTDFLFTWIPVFIILGFLIIGLLCFVKIRSVKQIVQIKEEKKERKKEETFAGSISKMIDDAPKNLKQIESDIATIQENA